MHPQCIAYGTPSTPGEAESRIFFSRKTNIQNTLILRIAITEPNHYSSAQQAPVPIDYQPVQRAVPLASLRTTHYDILDPLPDGLVQKLSKISEPNRYHTWLKLVFIEDPGSSVTLPEIWRTYHFTFANQVDDFPAIQPFPIKHIWSLVEEFLVVKPDRTTMHAVRGIRPVTHGSPTAVISSSQRQRLEIGPAPPSHGLSEARTVANHAPREEQCSRRPNFPASDQPDFHHETTTLAPQEPQGKGKDRAQVGQVRSSFDYRRREGSEPRSFGVGPISYPHAVDGPYDEDKPGDPSTLERRHFQSHKLASDALDGPTGLRTPSPLRRQRGYADLRSEAGRRSEEDQEPVAGPSRPAATELDGLTQRFEQMNLGGGSGPHSRRIPHYVTINSDAAQADTGSGTPSSGQGTATRRPRFGGEGFSKIELSREPEPLGGETWQDDVTTEFIPAGARNNADYASRRGHRRYRTDHFGIRQPSNKR